MNALILEADWAPRTGVLFPDPQARFAPMACTAWRNPRLVMTETPTPTPGTHDVVIDVKVCGICGSDTHCIETDPEGYVIFSGPAAFPCALGHEFAGRVLEVGAEVRRVQVGDLVTAEGMLYCGECAACTRGHVNQCRQLKMMGFSHPGAFSERVVLHEKHCWSINGLAETLGDATQACELASLVEPVGCSQNGMFVVGPGVTPKSHVAVFGCGPIGLGAIALARAAGAASITAFDRTKGRLELAKTMGADHAHNVDGMLPTEAAEAIRQASGGWGADMVVEAAGAAHHTMPICEAAIAPGATIVYLGRTGERVPVMLDVLVSNAARIVGARGHAGFGIFAHIIELLETGTLDLRPMITHKAPLSDYGRAFERSRSREDGKILLVQP
jgi:threonine dehydrogenase-like Zn-dependent dehydrogenase